MTLEQAIKKCQQAEMLREKKQQEMDHLKVSLLDCDSESLGDAVKSYIVTMQGGAIPSLAGDAIEAFGTIAHIKMLELEC